MKPRVWLIHWKESELPERVERLGKLGYRTSSERPSPATLKEVAAKPPVAVIIDLSRVPSQGRDVAVGLRCRARTQKLPLIFVDGKPEKVEPIRRLIPDAFYTTWEALRDTLAGAIRNPPPSPVTFDSVMAAYSKSSLAQKLGIEKDWTVLLLGAPTGFEKQIDALPAGVRFTRRAGLRPDMTLWFVKSRKSLATKIDEKLEYAQGGRLWIIWPKMASPIRSDLTQQKVREAAMASGLVDFKISRIDDTWTGLRFSRREERA